MARTANIAIIGGGVIGVSIAYHLADHGASDVVLFEREDALGKGSTGKCAGGVRLQFSDPANISMSQLSIAAFKRFRDELGCSVDYRQNGYLFLLTSQEDLDVFTRNVHSQKQMGVPVNLLDAQEVKELAPYVVSDDLVGGTFCPEDGIANPHAIVQGYSSNAVRLGVDIKKVAEVTEIKVSRERVKSIRVDEEEWEVSWLVNAAGPWAQDVGALAGVRIPVEPIRRQYFITKPMRWIPRNFPLLIDWETGVYMHEESGGLLVGQSDQNEEIGFNVQVDWDFLARVGEDAIARVPRLAEADIQSGVAGLYEVTPDHNAIIGPVPGFANFVCANGFSGHGMQHAPAVGIAVAELILTGAPSSVSLESYRFDRFSKLETRPEFNVI